MIAWLKKFVGTKNDREVKRLGSVLAKINALEEKLKSYPDEKFPELTAELKKRVENGASLDDVLPEAFATVREAARRVRGERHFDVQLIGGMALNEGKIAEMKTGEGKTLTATAPIYLNALTGKGCHVVTVNDYLAKRDAQTMGEVYGFLGLKTGCIVHDLDDDERKEQYASDITYGTNNEFGFDYLRDNMKVDSADLVQRGHNFAIVDEVDSILIDEARTPLIISGPTESNLDLFYKINATIPGLQKDSDYIFDEKSRVVTLTEDGINKVERRLRIENIYDPQNIDQLHHVQQALKAHVVFKKDVDYVVRENKVVIVDEFTGRLMPGRRYSDGLHGALEAKEHVQVQSETQTLATITFQNYFRLYSKLAGMTGTADTEAVEFKKIYNLEVLCVPTNRKVIRDDYEDEVYRTAREKYNIIADEIEKAQKKGQPVLVGTVSVEKSELLSNLLKKRGVPHEILNAKNHAREADIIKNAGQKGNVTISTNMAGRGTDIILGAGVADLGGLFVMGTERHESRRIDNQLRGRSGRQGDHGASKFFLSLEDDLMRIFASDRLGTIMGRLGMKEGEAIIAPMVSRAIERAQRRVEEQNFSSRKHLLEYDDVMNQQRQVIYTMRNEMLNSKHSELEFIASTIKRLVHQAFQESSPEGKLDSTQLEEKLLTELNYNLKDFVGTPSEETDLEERLAEIIVKNYVDKFAPVGKENLVKLEGYIFLQVMDRAWKNHLLAMDHLKDSVSLRGYGQRDPLQEYKREAYRLFEMLMQRISDETTKTLIFMEPPELVEEKKPVASQTPMKLEHASVPQGAQAAVSNESPSAENSKDDKMIYFGSRRNEREAEASPQLVKQTVRRDAPKVGRNDPCPCGSGKKFKKCHGLNSESEDDQGAET